VLEVKRSEMSCVPYETAEMREARRIRSEQIRQIGSGSPSPSGGAAGSRSASSLPAIGAGGRSPPQSGARLTTA